MCVGGASDIAAQVASCRFPASPRAKRLQAEFGEHFRVAIYAFFGRRDRLPGDGCGIAACGALAADAQARQHAAEPARAHVARYRKGEARQIRAQQLSALRIQTSWALSS